MLWFTQWYILDYSVMYSTKILCNGINFTRMFTTKPLPLRLPLKQILQIVFLSQKSMSNELIRLSWGKLVALQEACNKNMPFSLGFFLFSQNGTSRFPLLLYALCDEVVTPWTKSIHSSTKSTTLVISNRFLLRLI